MRIDGLTESDVKLLDAMWALDTTEELAAFIAKQSPGVRKRIMVLREMLLLGSIDDDVEEANNNSMANDMLRSIGIIVK
jgi:hypothetical protein